MSAHVSKIIQACHYQLINLWRIRRRLTKELRIQLVHMLIHSRLDYGNALLFGIKKEDIKRLQKIQNSAVRFVFCSKGRRGVTRMRKDLHFLPVEMRIKFKIGLLTYKCLHGLAPPYLSEMLSFRKQKVKAMRADCDHTLLERPFNTKYHSTESAFSICAPKLWNGLPREIREAETPSSFKKMLKTHLFGLSFSWGTRRFDIWTLCSVLCNLFGSLCKLDFETGYCCNKWLWVFILSLLYAFDCKMLCERVSVFFDCLTISIWVVRTLCFHS